MLLYVCCAIIIIKELKNLPYYCVSFAVYAICIHTEQPSGKSTVNRLLKMRFPFYVLCYVVTIGYITIYVCYVPHMSVQ